VITLFQIAHLSFYFDLNVAALDLSECFSVSDGQDNGFNLLANLKLRLVYSTNPVDNKGRPD